MRFKSGKHNCNVTTAQYLFLASFCISSSVYETLGQACPYWRQDPLNSVVIWRLNAVIDSFGFVDFDFIISLCAQCFPSILFSMHRPSFLVRLKPGYRQTTSLCPSVCHSMRAFDCTNFTGEKKKCRMHRATTSIVKLFHKSASKLLAYSTEQYYNDCSANREAVFSSVALSFFFSLLLKLEGIPRACVLFLEWLCI